MLSFIAVVQLITRLTAGMLKGLFEHLRPFEVIPAGNWDWKFFSGHGSAFPSGHSAFIWGLFFPLAFLFPRYPLPLLVIPVFISIARVGVNDHWGSDVVASARLAALITLVFIWIFRMKPAQGHVPPSPRDGRESRHSVMRSCRSGTMGKLTTLAAITLATLALGSGAAARKPKPVKPEVDYFPLRVGDSWTYRNSESGGYTLKVLSEEPQQSGPVRYVVELRSAVLIQNVFSKAPGWILLNTENYPAHEGLKATYEPPKQYLPNPPVAGQKWEWTGKDSTQMDRHEKNSVVGFENITVPAGKFRAVKVTLESSGGSVPMTKTFWYAPGVGLVKSMTEGGQIKYGSELTDYSFKKKAAK